MVVVSKLTKLGEQCNRAVKWSESNYSMRQNVRTELALVLSNLALGQYYAKKQVHAIITLRVICTQWQHHLVEHSLLLSSKKIAILKKANLTQTKTFELKSNSNLW